MSFSLPSFSLSCVCPSDAGDPYGELLDLSCSSSDSLPRWPPLIEWERPGLFEPELLRHWAAEPGKAMEDRAAAVEILIAAHQQARLVVDLSCLGLSTLPVLQGLPRLTMLNLTGNPLRNVPELHLPQLSMLMWDSDQAQLERAPLPGVLGHWQRQGRLRLHCVEERRQRFRAGDACCIQATVDRSAHPRPTRLELQLQGPHREGIRLLEEEMAFDRL